MSEYTIQAVKASQAIAEHYRSKFKIGEFIGKMTEIIDTETGLKSLLASHAALVEALESMIHRFGHLDTDTGKREAVKEANDALALAKEADSA